MSHSNCRKGAVFIELAFILPLLVLLICGGIEATRFALTKNRLISICRDISAEVYKSCQSLTPGTATQTCMQTETNNFYNKLSATIPARHYLSVQLFRASEPFNSTDPCPLDATHAQSGPSPLPSSPTTRIDTTTGSQLAVLCAGNGFFDPAQEVIVSAELHYVYEPIIGFIAQIFGYIPGISYVVTVI